MATFTVANGGGNINAAATFVGGVGIPGAADAIDFTATSGQLTVNVATTLLDINFSNYKNVITFTNSISVSRNITLSDTGGNATYTTAGAEGLVKTGTGTLISNNKIWTAKFTMGGSSNYTITFNDKLIVSGDVVFSNTQTTSLSPNNVLDPARLDIRGNFTQSGSTGILAPTATNGFIITFNGTGAQTWTGSSSIQVRVDIIINKASGTLTFSGAIYYNTGLFTYTAGTVDSGTSTLYIGGATFNTNGSATAGATTTSSTGINWATVRLTGNTLSLSSNFTVITSIIVTGNTTVTRSTSANIYLGGGLNMLATLTSSAAEIIMNGTGTWTGTLTLSAPLTFNTTGTITISGVVNFSTRTLTYTAAGSVVVTGSTLALTGSATLATNGMTWNNFSCNVAATITLTNNFAWSGGLNLSTANVTVNISYAGAGALAPTSAATVSLGSAQFGGVTTNHTIAFPTSTVLNIASLTLSCSGTTSVGFNLTVNNCTFNVSGNLTCSFSNQNTSTILGTSSSITMTGSGTILFSGSISSIVLSIPFTINATGTYTFAISGTGLPIFSTTVTYTAGTVTGTTVYFSACTLNLSAGGQWGTSVVIRGATTLTSSPTFGNLQTDTTAVTFTGAFTVNVKGNLTINIATSGASTPFIINGTGAQTWSHGAVAALNNNLTINKASGTLTIGANVYYATGTLTYTNADAVNTTTNSSTFNIGGSCTLSTSAITWFNFTVYATATITLSNNFYWTNTWAVTAGTVAFAGAGVLSPTSTVSISFSGSSVVNMPIVLQAVNATLGITTINSNSISLSGNLTVANTTSGTTTITLNGTGSQTWSHSAAAYINNTLAINKASGTLTISGAVYYGGTTLVYTPNASSVTTTGSTLNLNNNITLTTAGIVWNAINWTASSMTLSNALTASGLFTMTAQTPSINGSDFYANGGINYTGTNATGNYAFSSGTSLIRFEGTGSWTSPNFGTYRNNVLINPTGNFSINIYYALGTITYSSSNGGTVTSSTVILGYNTATTSINASRSATFDTSGMRWGTVYVQNYNNSSGLSTTTITCLSNLDVNVLLFTNIGGGTGDNINFSLLNGSNIVNVGNFYVDARVVVNLAKDVITNILTFATLSNAINNFSITVTGSMTLSSNQGGGQVASGTTKIILTNNCVWTQANSNFVLRLNVDIKGDVTIGTAALPNVYYNTGTITYVSGNVNGRNTSLLLTGATTLNNFHRMALNSVVITSGVNITMNQFFGGTPTFRTTVSPSAGTNYTITFSDAAERFARYVRVTRATISRSGQLTILNTKLSDGGNNVGIRYSTLQANNGLAKNIATSVNLQSYGANGLTSDPTTSRF